MRKRRPAERALGAGRRDRLVTIEALTPPSDGGFPVETWTELDTVWMSIERSQGSETFRSDQTSARIETQWEMEYRDDMDPELIDVAQVRRLSFQGRTYDITDGRQIGNAEAITLTTLAKAG